MQDLGVTRLHPVAAPTLKTDTCCAGIFHRLIHLDTNYS